MVKSTCLETNCENPSRSRGYCSRHYNAKRRKGELAPLASRQIHDLYGKRFGSLTALHYHESIWECLCDCGETTYAPTSKLTAGRKRSCGCQSWRIIGYMAAHDRLRRARGKADKHNCVGCGGAAAQWAYNHQDPQELICNAPYSKGYRYSLDADYYEPMCASCHKTLDNAVRRGDVDSSLLEKRGTLFVEGR